MKYLNLFLVILTLIACSEKEDLANAMVVKDCNGIFLKMENTYYQVCNEKILASVENGTKLNLNVKHIDSCDKFVQKSCPGPGPLLHGEWVEIIYAY